MDHREEIRAVESQGADRRRWQSSEEELDLGDRGGDGALLVDSQHRLLDSPAHKQVLACRNPGELCAAGFKCRRRTGRCDRSVQVECLGAQVQRGPGELDQLGLDGVQYPADPGEQAGVGIGRVDTARWKQDVGVQRFVVGQPNGAPPIYFRIRCLPQRAHRLDTDHRATAKGELVRRR